MEPEPLTWTEMWEISNHLAWAGVDAEQTIQEQFGLDGDGIERIMDRFGYEWDSDKEVWVSVRPVWSDSE